MLVGAATSTVGTGLLRTHAVAVWTWTWPHVLWWWGSLRWRRTVTMVWRRWSFVGRWSSHGPCPLGWDRWWSHDGAGDPRAATTASGSTPGWLAPSAATHSQHLGVAGIVRSHTLLRFHAVDGPLQHVNVVGRVALLHVTVTGVRTTLLRRRTALGLRPRRSGHHLLARRHGATLGAAAPPVKRATAFLKRLFTGLQNVRIAATRNSRADNGVLVMQPMQRPVRKQRTKTQNRIDLLKLDVR